MLDRLLACHSDAECFLWGQVTGPSRGSIDVITGRRLHIIMRAWAPGTTRPSPATVAVRQSWRSTVAAVCRSNFWSWRPGNLPLRFRFPIWVGRDEARRWRCWSAICANQLPTPISGRGEHYTAAAASAPRRPRGQRQKPPPTPLASNSLE